MYQMTMWYVSDVLCDMRKVDVSDDPYVHMAMFLIGGQIQCDLIY